MAQECCGTEEKNINKKALEKEHAHDANDGHNHGEADTAGWKNHLPLLSSLAVLLIMLMLNIQYSIFNFQFILPFHQKHIHFLRPVHPGYQCFFDIGRAAGARGEGYK